MISRLLFAPPLLGLLLAGCDTPASYPSLLPRSAENQTFAEPESTGSEAPAADPALDSRIAAALRTLQERITAFDTAAERVRRAVATAGPSPAGSAPWLDAQVALAELDSLRSSTQEVVIDLDDLASARAASLDGDYPALDAAAERARAAGAAQAARIGALQSALAPT